MKRLSITLLIAMMSIVVTHTSASAGAQGPKPKLAAPTNVTCPLTVDGVVVSFDAVPEANAYQVEFVCSNALGELREESVFILAPPLTVAEEDCTVVAVHVRALPGPKHEGGPLQGGGPKGVWSDICTVP